MMKIVTAEHLTKIYGQGSGEVRALDDVSLSIEEGKFTAIVGTSGSGKSTLLHLLGGLDYPTRGRVLIDGVPIFDLNPDKLTIFRRRNVGFIFQNYNLVSFLNVYKNIVLPIKLDGNRIDRDYIEEITGILGLSQKLKSLPGELSGGQQQRVGIARALAAKPTLILADEPTGNLDSKNSVEVVGLLKAMSSRFRQTIVMITHNEEIAQSADSIIRIEDGKIVGDRITGEGIAAGRITGSGAAGGRSHV